MRPMGRTAAGVRGMTLRKGDQVVDMAIVDANSTLLTVCENGYGKRTAAGEYRLQKRGGSGIINIRTTDRNGKVVGMKGVRDTDELMMITKDGMMVRTAVSELREIGRATQGVRVIALRPGDKLVDVAPCISEEAKESELALEAKPQGELIEGPEEQEE